MPNRKKTGANSKTGLKMLMNIALVMFVIFCAVSIVTTQNAVVEKKKELAQLEEEVEVLSAQNEELAELIASDDIGKYMEKLAIESAGYAYPDEKRYYDTSRK
ncbi:MAG: septum formation initiator family protein [Oscillospiraceae bacterium]|nr:septum formation initiator family protein [Oscillospiraceae bacterium]MDE6005871.1 septum formation initiator family protein [Oscillospiraceae bacterium]MDE6658441.1 septum formation initiator family protein [Oscillospiraceae bacterium]